LGELVVTPGAEVTLADPLAVSVAVHDHVLLQVFDVEVGGDLVGANGAGTVGHCGAKRIAVALLRGAVGRCANRPVEVTPQNDVYHAGDGVRTVDRGRAVFQDLDAFHRLHRDDAQVREDFLSVVG